MDFNTITGQEILDRISRHCPEALTVYLHCVNRTTRGKPFYFSRDMVENECSETWTKFKNNIRKLALENLLDWHPLDLGLSITLLEDDE